MKLEQRHTQNSTTSTQKGVTSSRRAVRQRQDLFIKLYVDSLFSVSEACRSMPLHRSTYYLWLKNDPVFAQRMDDARETKFDFIESALMKKIKSGDPICTIFACKCLLKQRNYVETTRHEIEFSPISKEQKDAAVNGLIQAQNLKRQLNFPEDLRDKLRLPPSAPDANNQTVDDHPIDDRATGHGVQVQYDTAGKIIDIDAGPCGQAVPDTETTGTDMVDQGNCDSATDPAEDTNTEAAASPVDNQHKPENDPPPETAFLDN